eukprot:COSAG01_NODE_63_length_29632_cov_270.650662_38_plen_197_part_00
MGPFSNILLQRRGVLTSRNNTFLNSFLCVQKPWHCQSNVSFLPFFWAPIANKQPKTLSIECLPGHYADGRQAFGVQEEASTAARWFRAGSFIYLAAACIWHRPSALGLAGACDHYGISCREWGCARGAHVCRRGARAGGHGAWRVPTGREPYSAARWWAVRRLVPKPHARGVRARMLLLLACSAVASAADYGAPPL